MILTQNLSSKTKIDLFYYVFDFRGRLEHNVNVGLFFHIKLFVLGKGTVYNRLFVFN